MNPNDRPELERFRAFLWVGTIPEDTYHDGKTIVFLTPCLEFRGATDNTGYGVFKAAPKTMGSKTGVVRAHRYAFHLMQKFPNKFQIDHLCRNRLCVRFAHLQLVGPKEHGKISKKDQE
jgi:hypothetical protein